MKKFIIQSNKILLTSLLLICIQACGNKSPSTQITSSEQRADLEQLIKQAQLAEPNLRSKLYLQAAGLLVLESRFEKAQELLIRIEQQYLTPLQVDDFHLFYGETLYGLEAYDLALQQLNSIVSPQMKSVAWQIRYAQSHANCYLANGNAFESAKTRIELEDLIDNDELLQANNEKIWESLNNIESSFLKSLITDFNSQRLNGWLEIVYINKQWGHQPKMLMGQIEQWKNRFPLHPAQIHQPETLQRAASAEVFEPKQIAVLLPLSGKNTVAGLMIQDGILSAHYQSQYANQAPQVRFYDTAKSLSAITTYQQAIEDGADFVVGPLTKESIETILRQEIISTPLLTLNRLASFEYKEANVFQFGLPIEDEAIQTAHYAYENGYRKAIAFLPENGEGARAEIAFREYFEQLGGELIDVKTYKGFKSLKTDIQQLLGVDKSMQRKRSLESLLGRNLEFEMRRRKDGEFVFLVARPNLGRSIKPFIDFHYAHDLPVIATSMIYSGETSAKKDIDLNGISFPDMPLVISQLPQFVETRDTLAQVQPDALDARGRLFALGFDAYKVINQLAVLRAFPEYRWQGLTGELGVDENGVIHRYLTWAKFNKGVPQIIKEREPVKQNIDPADIPVAKLNK